MTDAAQLGDGLSLVSMRARVHSRVHARMRSIHAGRALPHGRTSSVRRCGQARCTHFVSLPVDNPTVLHRVAQVQVDGSVGWRLWRRLIPWPIRDRSVTDP